MLRQFFRIFLLFAFFAGCSACSALRVPTPKPTPTPRVIRVSADEIALAMQEDHFFSDYRDDGLDVQGTVTSVNLQKDHYVLELATQIETKVLCELGSQVPGIKPGDSVIVRSLDANQAVRAPGAVLLPNCRLSSSAAP